MKNEKTAPIVIPTKRSARRNPLFYTYARKYHGKSRDSSASVGMTKGFSLVELLIVIAVIGILSSVSYFAIQGSAERAKNARMTDDLLAISSALEEYKLDHSGKYPVPAPSSSSDSNILCFYMDSTYAHDCAKAAFVQSSVSASLLSSRYLRTVPTDPRTGSPYTYSVTSDGGYYQIAGISEEDGSYTARIIGNLSRGFSLPSIIRAYDSDEFVTDKGKHLPYSPSPNELTGKLRNIKNTVTVPGKTVSEGLVVSAGDTVKTNPSGSADIFFSDGSVTHVDPNTTLTLKSDSSSKNDSKGTLTKILLKLNSGKIWNKVARLSSKSSFDVETSSAIAGVRGTEFGVEYVNSNEFRVAVLSGEVDVYKIGGAKPSSASLSGTPSALQMASFDGNGSKTASTPSGNPLATIIQNYYSKIPLNSTMVPRILSVKGGQTTGTITVRDINYYAAETDKLLSLPAGTSRKIDATHLAVYSDSQGTKIIGTPLVLSGAAIPYPLVSLPLDTPLHLRFEKRSGSNILTSTPFTFPITIKTSTAPLTEQAIYSAIYSSASSSKTELPPEIKVTAPYFASYKVGVDNSKYPYTFRVDGEIKNYTMTTAGITYVVTTSGSTASCATAKPLSPTLSETFSFDMKITGPPAGDCKITVSADIGGKEVKGTATVDVVKPTPKLLLKSPKEGITAATGKKISFEWDTGGMPDDYASYRITIKKGTQTEKTAAVTHSASSPENSYVYDYTPSSFGNYTWEVVLLDKRKMPYEELEGQKGTFTVGTVPPKINLADFKITQGNKTILNLNETKTTIATDGTPMEFSVEAKPVSGSGYTYEWNLDNFSFPVTAPTASPFNAKPVIPGNNTSRDARITLTVRDSQGIRQGFMAKTVTISYFTLISGISFPPAPLVATVGSPLTIPSLTANPQQAGPVTPDKCSSLTAPAGSGTVTKSQGSASFIASSSAVSPVALTCTIDPGTMLNGHAVGGTAITANINVALQGTTPPAIIVTANPTSIDVNSAGTVAIAATGGTGTITCIRKSGGGTLTGMQYSPKDSSIASRFATASAESVTIECTDTAQQKSSVTLTVNYKPFKTSSNYMYSHAGSNNVDWTTAKSACNNLTEGGYTNWLLPNKDKLADNTERKTWCDESASSCLNMPSNAKVHWAIEEDPADNTKAYKASYLSGTPATTILKNTININYGYRCTRSP